MLGKTSNVADLLNSHGGTIVTAFPAPSLSANECASEAESEQIEIWPNWRNGEREREATSLSHSQIAEESRGREEDEEENKSSVAVAAKMYVYFFGWGHGRFA